MLPRPSEEHGAVGDAIRPVEPMDGAKISAGDRRGDTKLGGRSIPRLAGALQLKPGSKMLLSYWIMLIVLTLPVGAIRNVGSGKI